MLVGFCILVGVLVFAAISCCIMVGIHSNNEMGPNADD
jgi:hypothetical protein